MLKQALDSQLGLGGVFITNTTGEAIYTAAHGISGTAGTAGRIDQGIGQYGADGKLRDIGTTFITKASGNLAFIG